MSRDRAQRARSAAASDPRPQGEARAARDRPARLAGRGERRDRLLRRRGAGFASGGTEVDPGPRRDLARGHSRHARRRGHRDDARRHDLACGGGRARHGQALRLRRRRDPHRLRRADDDRGRGDAEKGRHPHHRRRLGRGHAGRGADGEAGADRRFRHADELGRRGQADEGARQRRDRRPTRASPASSAPRASAFAAPSTCSSTASASSRCAR